MEAPEAANNRKERTTRRKGDGECQQICIGKFRKLTDNVQSQNPNARQGPPSKQYQSSLNPHRQAPIPPLPRSQHQSGHRRESQGVRLRGGVESDAINILKTGMPTAMAPNHHAEGNPTTLGEILHEWDMGMQTVSISMEEILAGRANLGICIHSARR